MPNMLSNLSLSPARANI